MASTHAEPCPICGESATAFCGKCRAIKYCSKECMETDYPSHRLLCGSFKDPPSEAHRRVLFFHHIGKKPEFLWKEVKSIGDGIEQPDMTQQFGTIEPVYEVIDTNPISGVKLDHTIHLCIDDDYATKYNTANQAVVTAAGPCHQEGLTQWAGPILAYACDVDENGGVKVRDMTLADYSHLMAFMVNFWNESEHHATHKGPKIEAVKVRCDGDLKAGRARLEPVKVPRFHVNIADAKTFQEVSSSIEEVTRFKEISPISEAIGMPLTFTRLIDFTPKAADPSNEIISTMLLSIDPTEKHDASKEVQGFGWPPAYWDAAVGNVLIYRDSFESLSLDTVEAFALFCKRIAFHFRELDEEDVEAKRARKEEMLTPEAWKEFLQRWEEDKLKLVNEINEETDGETEDLVGELKGLKLEDGKAKATE